MMRQDRRSAHDARDRQRDGKSLHHHALRSQHGSVADFVQTCRSGGSQGFHPENPRTPRTPRTSRTSRTSRTVLAITRTRYCAEAPRAQKFSLDSFPQPGAFMSRSWLACACFLFVVAAGGSALAQAQPTPTGPPRQPAATAAPQQTKLGSLDLTVNWRSRAEDWGWFAGNSGDSNYGLGHSQLRLGVGQKRRRVDWFLEGEQATIFLLPNGAVAPAPLGQLGLGGTYYAA